MNLYQTLKAGFGRKSAYGIIALATIAPALVIPFTDGPWHTLSDSMTDHYRHAYSAWAFLHVGTDIWTTPIKTWEFAGAISNPPHGGHSHLYPLGSIFLFLPFGVLTYGFSVPASITNMLMVGLFTATAAPAMMMFDSANRFDTEIGILSTLFVGVLALYWGYRGFFDVVVLCISLFGVWMFWRENYRNAFVALVVACSLHFRIWYLGPLTLLAGWKYYQSNGIDVVLGAGTLYGAASALTGVLTLTQISTQTGQQEFIGNPFSLTQGAEIAFPALLLGIAAAAIIILSESRLLLSSTVILAGASVFLLPQYQWWYPLLYTPALALVKEKPSQIALVFVFLTYIEALGYIPNPARIAIQIAAAIV